jgi:purine nucleosidase/pyrimidine-specific ribonucleoside hydrolase
VATKIILDTDIGDDVDDALALGLICASGELELLGVTTVFANVQARSRQARSILKVAGGKFLKVPVAAGCGASMASRPMDNAKAYLEGRLPNQDASCFPEAELPKPDPRHGVDFLIDTLLSGSGDIVPVTIGAMTNLAMAMIKEPRIISKIPKVVAMAAEVKKNFSEWNIHCDPEAAALVFQSGLPIDVTTSEIGTLCSFDRSHIDRLLVAKAGSMASHLGKTIELWQKSEKRMPSLFDPLALATMFKNDLVTWKTGTVTVDLQGNKTYGYTTFEEGASGPHRVAWTVDSKAALDFYIERILSMDAAGAA